MKKNRSGALRGSQLEEQINDINEAYRRLGSALVQKIPTPITPMRMDHRKHQITLAYFEKRSTVDYIGGRARGPGLFRRKGMRTGILRPCERP